MVPELPESIRNQESARVPKPNPIHLTTLDLLSLPCLFCLALATIPMHVAVDTEMRHMHVAVDTETSITKVKSKL